MISALRCRCSFSSLQRNASSISAVEISVEKIEEYDLACTLSMKAMLVYTASSCGVSASGIRLTAPTVPWMVSSIVSPVNTRVVISCSSWLSVCQDWTSLDSGTFSGSQKLPVRRCQTSTPFSSSTRFQLLADTRLARGSFSEAVILLPSQGSWSMFGVLRARASQHAAHAILNLGAFQRQLTQPDVVQGLDALAPGVDLGLVQVTSGDGVLEEQRQAQPLVHVLCGDGVGVDDLLVADF